MPHAFIHRGYLIMAHDIAPLHIVAFLGTLVRNVIDKHDTIPGFRIQDNVFLCFTPLLEFRTIQRIGGAVALTNVRL